MATAVFLLCVVSLLCVWDMTIKLLVLLDYRLARSFVDARVAFMAERLLRVARAYVGLRFETDTREARDLPESFLIVSNHQSLVDIVALFATLGQHDVRFVAKRELMRWVPAVSWVLRLQRHALIDRKAHRMETMQQLDALADRAVAEGSCPVVFPEGTRSRDGEVQAFHSGALRRLLSRARLPVLSVAVDGGYRFGRVTQLANNVRGGVYRLRVLSLHPAPETKEQFRETLNCLKEEISTQIQSWRSKDRYA
jgi:1-acyl-sn-glycerol-3-phosphate acyltransferase